MWWRCYVTKQNTWPILQLRAHTLLALWLVSVHLGLCCSLVQNIKLWWGEYDITNIQVKSRLFVKPNITLFAYLLVGLIGSLLGSICFQMAQRALQTHISVVPHPAQALWEHKKNTFKTQFKESIEGTPREAIQRNPLSSIGCAVGARAELQRDK